MATFAKSLETKLKSLEPSQTGIQTLSLWIIHHRHHSGIITNAWVERVKKAKVEKRISLFYLANDVIQNGRKKAKELVTAFGKAFLDVMSLYRDSHRIKSQVERVLSIWAERSVYDAGYVKKLKEILNSGGVVLQPASPVKTSPIKVETPVKPKQKTSSVSSNPSSGTKKNVPSNFKVSTLLVSIKKTASLSSDAERKSKKLEGMKIDATSYDSIKNVKDRSSVGHFHKEFDESKVMLEDYINTLRHNVHEKQKSLPLLNSSEAFYALAQDEAKVIVNAYKTFGNRLNTMKRKLDAKISKLEDDSTRTPEDEQTDSRGHKMRSSSGGSIQDMDLDSESEEDIASSRAYNPSTAPSHEDLALQGKTPSFLPTNGGMTSFLDSSASTQLLPMVMSADIAAMSNTLPEMSQPSSQESNNDQQNPAVQTLIDSLFPVLSKSLQTIKEKTHVGDETPSVNAAMAFALGNVADLMKQDEAIAVDPSKAISPVSLTNPNGLSDHQTELINIAAGVTELDANCLPLSRAQSVDEEKLEKKQHENNEEHDRRRDDRKSSSSTSSRHRHRSHRNDDNRHRRSSSRSPQRRSSHRSSRDDRRDRDRRRSSRKSPSPRRRSSKGGRRRSSSRERGGEKRKHSSAEERDRPYYNNNRRSPTPEMDAASNAEPVAATSSQFQPASNEQQQQQLNSKPMMISSFQPVDSTVSQQPAPTIQQCLQQTEEHPLQPFVNSNITPVAPTFQQQQSTDDMEQSDEESNNTPVIQLPLTQPFPFNANPLENMVQTLNPLITPPQMNFPPTPMQQAAMNLVRGQNPLQLLQQDENMSQPPPFVPPPFVPPPFFVPPQQLQPTPQPDMTTNEPNPFNPIMPGDNQQPPSFPGPPPIPPFLQQQPPQDFQPPPQDFQPPHQDFQPPHQDFQPPHQDFQPPPRDFQLRPPLDFNPQGFPQRPDFQPPLHLNGINSDVFPPVHPEGPGNFGPLQNFDNNMSDNENLFNPQQQQFNQNRPPFNENRPQFRPRFQNKSPRRNFRPRGGNFNGPRQFHPRHPRPVL